MTKGKIKAKRKRNYVPLTEEQRRLRIIMTDMKPVVKKVLEEESVRNLRSEGKEAQYMIEQYLSEKGMLPDE